MINMHGQIILAMIPSFITQLIAFYRIRKFTRGITIELIIFLVDVLIQMIVQWPFGMIVAWPFTVGIPVYFVRKWTIEYNNFSTGIFS
jgi:hypothetical protein